MLATPTNQIGIEVKRKKHSQSILSGHRSNYHKEFKILFNNAYTEYADARR